MVRKKKKSESSKKIEDIKDYLDKIDESHFFVVKGNNIKDVLELVQQLVYLGKNVPVYTEEDLEYQKVYLNLKKHKHFLIQKLNELRSLIETKISDSIVPDRKEYEKDRKIVSDIRNNILQSVSNAINELPKIDREVKVAVMATKKSGKSMVVNCVLGEEYAPTSLEIPTPNIITYIPSEDGRLALKYKGELKYFSKPQELREYIKEQFKTVQDSGEALEDMEIYYPYRSGTKFYILDTPGPDLAKSQHNVVDKVLNFEPDVVVFVIDYTKHAQSSEIELFERIREKFKEKEILDMVICLVNKVDTVFQDADTEKSKLRVAAFINNKFKEIGYDNIVVIPTSALISFYLYKLLDVLGDELRETEDIIEFLRKKEVIEKTKGEELKTYRKQVENFANVLFDDDDEEKGFEKIAEFTGIDLFKGYLDIVISGKVEAKKAKIVSTDVESYITSVRNSVENLGLKDFRQKASLLKNELISLKDDIGNLLREIVNIENDFRDTVESIEHRVKESLEKVAERVFYKMEARLENFILDKKKEIFDDLEQLRLGKIDRKSFEKKWSYIQVPKDELFPAYMVEIITEGEISGIKIVLDKKQKEFNEELRTIDQSLKEKFDNFKERVKRDYGVELNIRTPNVYLNIDLQQIHEFVETAVINLTQNLHDIALEYKHFSEGIKGGVWRFFGNLVLDKDRYDTSDFENRISEIMAKFLKESQEYIEKFVYGKNFMDIVFDMDRQLKKLKSENQSMMRTYRSEIEKALSNLSNFVELDTETCEKVSRSFEEIYSSDTYKELIETWETVMQPVYLKKKEIEGV